MSLFKRRPRKERRDAVVMPRPMFVYGSAASYVDVDVTSTMEASLQSVAVRSTADLICSLSSELPVDVFSGKGNARREISMPSYLEDPAGDGYGLEDWIYQVVESWLLRGNMYGEVVDRAPSGFPRQIDLWHPDKVRGELTEGKVDWFHNGVRVPDGRMLHRRVNPIPGVVLGLSPIQSHAADLGLDVTLTRFGMQYFKDGAAPVAVLRNTEKSIETETVARGVKERFMAAVRGSREPVVMGKGWEFETIPINPEESQFLESRGFTSAQCARIFGPGFAELLGYTQAGSSLTYSNLVDKDLHILKYGLSKWLRRVDRLLTEMLPRPQWARLKRDALLETSTMQRYLAHAKATGGAAWKTPNEVRQDEDLDPIPGGDVLVEPKSATPGPDDDAKESGTGEGS